MPGDGRRMLEEDGAARSWPDNIGDEEGKAEQCSLGSCRFYKNRERKKLRDRMIG